MQTNRINRTEIRATRAPQAGWIIPARAHVARYAYRAETVSARCTDAEGRDCEALGVKGLVWAEVL